MQQNFGNSFATQNNRNSTIPQYHHPNFSFQQLQQPQQAMQEHDVSLDHLKVGDEVVWIPDGEPVSIHKLDIGKVQRTVYSVNQDSLLATVDFNDRVENAKEVIDPKGQRFFRLLVYVKHLRKLGDFLEDNVKRTGNVVKSGRLNYVMRPCVLGTKLPATHNVITEYDQIYNFYKNRVVHGSVKRMLTSDGIIYIGAEFESEVYPQELEHSSVCPFVTNGCERRIAINIINMTKLVWDTEFKLIVNKNRQATFEDLFERNEEPPPSYFDATTPIFSTPPMFQPNPGYFSTPQPQYPNYFPPTHLIMPTAPPLAQFSLTPSPPYYSPPPQYPAYSSSAGNNMSNWATFNEPETQQKFGFEQFSPQGQQPQSTMSKAYSMINLDWNSVPPTNARSSLATPPPVKTSHSRNPPQQSRQSSLVNELKTKLKIQIQSIPESETDWQSTRPVVEEPQITPVEVTPTITNINPRHNLILEELKRRQNKGVANPASNDKPSISEQSKLQNTTSPFRKNSAQQETLTKPPIATIKPTPREYNAPSHAKISQHFGVGLSRATSCMNISTTLPPKPILAPKPLTPKPKPINSKEINSSSKLSDTFNFSYPVQKPETTTSTPTILPSLPQRPVSLPPTSSALVNPPSRPPAPLSPPPARPFSLNNPTSTSFVQPPPPVAPFNPPVLENISENAKMSVKDSRNMYPSLAQEINYALPSKPKPPSPVIMRQKIEQPLIPPDEKTSANRVSRVNLPPPPPPPIPVSKDNQHSIPAPPPQEYTTSEDNFGSRDDRGSFLQQIREGVNLRRNDNDTKSNQQRTEKQDPEPDAGFESILKGAIKSRRMLMDEDEDDASSDSEYEDEDSDGWD